MTENYHRKKIEEIVDLKMKNPQKAVISILGHYTIT